MIRVALILSLLAAPAFGGTFYPLGARYVDGISADGSVAVAYRTAEVGGKAGALLWTRQRTTELGLSQASDISADGSTVVAGEHTWTVDGSRSYPSPLAGVSGDGSKVVSRDGTLFTATGQIDLGFTATDISADGNWVVGQKDGLPYLWNGEGKFLGDQPVTEGLSFDAYVSADGSIVHLSDYGHYRAVRWRKETGAVDAPYFAHFTGVSSNGLFAVGRGGVIDDQGETHVLTVDGFAPSYAYAEGWALYATVVSDDGLTLGGFGWRSSTKQYEAWIYDGHDRLPGDANSDGQVDLSDFGTLKANFGSGRSWSYGDFDGSGRIDLSDFGILRNQFGQAPPNAVPEPSTWLLAAMASLCFARWMPWRRG